MIKIIYKELPIDKISYLAREEFSPTGPEKDFYNLLKNSMSKHGLKDPVHIEYGGEDYGDILKVLVGNNRMVICKKLGIKKIKCIITQIGKEDTFLKGRVLKTDKEIKDLFYLPEEITVRRTKGGWVDQVNATKFITIRNKYGT